MRAVSPFFPKLALVLACLFALLSVAATCSLQEAQDALSFGSSYVFEDSGPVSYVLVLDRSGSMRGDKLLQAKSAAQRFVERLSRGDQAAIIGFDSRVTVYQDFTEDKELLKDAIGRIRVGDFTQYAGALERARELFNGGRHVIVFLSDGQPDDPEDELFTQVANLIGDNACMFTIAYADSADIQAQQILDAMAQASIDTLDCGGYSRAEESTFDLERLFESIYDSVSSDDILDVTTNAFVDGNVSFSVQAVSTLNNVSVFSLGCFDPEVTVVITNNRQLVTEKTFRASDFSFELPAGEYEYFLTVRETCGGNCSFTGEDEGSFTVDVGDTACLTPWEDMAILLTNTEYVEVHITDKGYVPQTAGTQGLIVWKNVDDKPHQIRVSDGSLISPVIGPGESWSHLFAPGVYAYSDVDATFSGVLRNDQVSDHDPVDLVLVMDRSGSMAGLPLDSAQQASYNLINVISPQDRAAVVVFSDKAELAQQLTSDQQRLRAAITSVRSEGSTYYSDALKIAGSQLLGSTASRTKVVIFLSDGAPFDDGGKDSILKIIDAHLGDACLFAIGYGEQSREALDLLESMAAHVQKTNGCGEFFFSSTQDTQLSEVFGEIYAMTQEPGLELFDIQLPEESSGTVTVSARVRSLRNGLQVPSLSQFGCIPPAEVTVEINGEEYPMAYSDGTYTAQLELKPGVYTGQIVARLRASDQPSRAVIGFSPIELSISGTAWWMWLIPVIIVLLAAYFFMRRTNRY